MCFRESCFEIHPGNMAKESCNALQGLSFTTKKKEEDWLNKKMSAKRTVGREFSLLARYVRHPRGTSVNVRSLLPAEVFCIPERRYAGNVGALHT